MATAIDRLVRQLSESAASPSPVELEEIVASPASRLLVARDRDGMIVGTLTLVVFRIPTGVRAWIESRPSRTAANRLYMKMGFRPRTTAVYRFEGPIG
jgi:ribosomal protein S18 acetylase RimI-like enzyme